MSQRVLIVAAHPDDEVLGCGATAARHARSGEEVHVLILAEGITSRSLKRKTRSRQSELSALRASAVSAGDILGAATVTLGKFPDNRMDSVNLLDVVKVVETFIHRLRPQIVYTHHGGDLNIDHRLTQQAVVTACRPVAKHPVESLLFFEVPSSTEWQAPCRDLDFRPSWFINVSETLAVKIEALKAYSSEIRPWPHPRSVRAVEHLAGWRGSTIGVSAAEAFMVGRHRIG